MKTFSLCFTSIFFHLLIMAQSGLHMRALNYYVKITNNTKDAHLSMLSAAQILTNYASIASQTESFKLDGLRLDTLKKSFSLLISVLRSNITKLDSTIEVDSVISLKDSVKSIYKEAISAFDKIFRQLITIFEPSLKPESKEEISYYWAGFQSAMKLISSKLDILGKNSSLFLKKYDIHTSELKLYGL